jgi:hypothetical protein
LFDLIDLCSIKFLSLRRADPNSLTYEYVKPASAIEIAQLKKDKWAHALLLGGPLRRQELLDPKVLEWVRLNSKTMREVLNLIDPLERDPEHGLILVLRMYTAPGFTDVKLLNHGESLAPVVMGCARTGGGSSKWVRGYPVDAGKNTFNGQFIISEGEVVRILAGTN